MEMDFRKLRKKASLTLAEVSARSGWSAGTISDLETKDVGGPQLRAKLLEIYSPNSAVKSSDSEIEKWRLRARDAEQKLANLKRGLRNLLEEKPINSNVDCLHEELLEARTQQVQKHPKVPHV